jgi:hypothetical protein
MVGFGGWISLNQLTEAYSTLSQPLEMLSVPEGSHSISSNLASETRSPNMSYRRRNTQSYQQRGLLFLDFLAPNLRLGQDRVHPPRPREAAMLHSTALCRAYSRSSLSLLLAINIDTSRKTSVSAIYATRKQRHLRQIIRTLPIPGLCCMESQKNEPPFMVSKKPSSSSSRAAAPAASTVPPSQLGLTNGEEIATFQRHQQVALSRANNNARTAAANGRVLVDANSLMLLANYFDRVMTDIQQRADHVSKPSHPIGTCCGLACLASTCSGVSMSCERLVMVQLCLLRIRHAFKAKKHLLTELCFGVDPSNASVGAKTELESSLLNPGRKCRDRSGS